jgi:hypothetical protein
MKMDVNKIIINNVMNLLVRCLNAVRGTKNNT